MRQRRKRLQQIIEECYRELYREATPSADFDELLEKAELDQWGRKIIDYDAYYVPREKFEAIVEKHKKRMKMDRYEESSYNLAVYLGATPTCKKREE